MNDTCTLLLVIYVDDGILFGKNEKKMFDLLTKLEQNFETVSEDNSKTFFGLEIQKKMNSIFIGQEKYVSN